MAASSAFSNTITRIKGLAILLVVLGHIASPFGAIIFSFHIPLFFFLGGIFIKTGHAPADFFRRNLSRLMLPYLIFGALGLAVNDIKEVLLHRPVADLLLEVTGLLYWMDSKHLQHYGMVLWFLPALFWARMASYGLLKYFKWGELPAFVLCAGAAGLSAALPDTSLPFALDKGMLALPWVYAGAVFMRHKEVILSMPAWYGLATALFVYLMLHFGGLPAVNMAGKVVGQLPLTLPYTLALITLMIWLAHKLPGLVPAIVGKFGAESMLVYVLHPYTNNGAYLLSTHFLGEGYWYVKFALTVAMLLVLIQIKLRYPMAPFFKYL
jgi:fucose 4-O-acetylase-like acetyltransferase